MLLGEVAPAAPALGPLVALALLIVAFGIVFVVRKLMNALFGWLVSALEAVPLIGGKLAGPFKTVEQSVANVLGSAESNIDAAIGASWHLLARYMDWLWREIRGHAVLLLQMASLLPVIGAAVEALRALLHHNAATGTAQAAQLRTLEREYRGIEHQVKTLEREFHGIDEVGVRRQLRALDKELQRVETQTIPAIQQSEADAASAISNLYEWAKGKASLLGVGTFTTAVAAVLAAVGLDWIGCRSRNNVNGKSGCGLWDEIEAVLGLATIALVAGDLEEIAKEMQGLERPVTTALADLTGVAGKIGL